MLWLLAIMLVVGSHAPGLYAASVTAEESKLRAAIVLGILRFTEWPNGAQIVSEINLCTYGTPLAEPALNQISGLHRLNNVPVKVRTLRDANISISGCNALILGGQASLDALNKAGKTGSLYGVLTICDSCKAQEFRSMVNLIRLDKRIGFEIDLQQATQNGMHFSSSLLELAVEVIQ